MSFCRPDNKISTVATHCCGARCTVRRSGEEHINTHGLFVILLMSHCLPLVYLKTKASVSESRVAQPSPPSSTQPTIHLFVTRPCDFSLSLIPSSPCDTSRWPSAISPLSRVFHEKRQESRPQPQPRFAHPSLPSARPPWPPVELNHRGLMSAGCQGAAR